MSKRLRAVKGLMYPDANSLPIVREAGGLSRLTPEQRKKVKLREISSGDWCDDLPEESREHLIKKGTVVVVQTSEVPKTKKTRKAFLKGSEDEDG